MQTAELDQPSAHDGYKAALQQALATTRTGGPGTSSPVGTVLVSSACLHKQPGKIRQIPEETSKRKAALKKG